MANSPAIGDLMKIGFSQKQALLYWHLLERGGGLASELAAVTGLKRPTVYKLLGELESAHLVAQTMRGAHRVFLPENPENLLARIELEKRHISEILPVLQNLFQQHSRRPRLRFFEGIEGVRYVNEQLLNASCEYYYFGSMFSSAEVLGEDYLADYTRRRVRKRIWSNGIYPKSKKPARLELQPGAENYRRVRYLEQEAMNKVGTLTLMDNKILICSTQSECYGIIIESADLYSILKLVWDALWQVAEP